MKDCSPLIDLWDVIQAGQQDNTANSATSLNVHSVNVERQFSLEEAAER